jgi:hypothetical protein
MRITIFKSITKTDTPYFVTPQDIIERIGSQKDIDLVEAIRKETDNDARNDIKRQLPAICWSGTFTHRADSALEDHSGLICLDFDKYATDEALNAEREDTTDNGQPP